MSSKPGRAWSAVALAAFLASTACSGDETGTASARSPRPSTPATSPAPGEPIELEMGEPASFTLTSGSGRSSRVDLAVTKVEQGEIKDLSDFELNAEAKSSTPYYATVKVTNTGDGNLSGARLSLWGFDSEGVVRPPAEVVGTFSKCQQERLPKRFRNGRTARTCMIYLLPQGSALDAVQYRFNDDRSPYSWPVG